MQKVLIGIFAHPDDEAFGPSGTILRLGDEGFDIYLILLTSGEAGMNPDDAEDLGSVRLEEWRKSAGILGAKETFALGHPDGGLKEVPEQTIYPELSLITSEIIAKYDETPELHIMTLEPEGLTGHYDHIAASALATKLASEYDAHKVWYFCLHHTQAPLGETPYCEPSAREESYITNKFDVSNWLDKKYKAMDAHATQRADAASVKKLGDELLSMECFCVKSNSD